MVGRGGVEGRMPWQRKRCIYRIIAVALVDAWQLSIFLKFKKDRASVVDRHRFDSDPDSTAESF
jgi:hypothetical protein